MIDRPGDARGRSRLRRSGLRRRVAGALVAALIALEGEGHMATALASDEETLQAYLAIEVKYHPAPVPTPLGRAAAVRFVTEHVSPAASPDRMRKLMRVAVFYDLRETAPAFAGGLTGSEASTGDLARSALAVVALAWIGTAQHQSAAQDAFHGLQRRADVLIHRDIMREVVEAFGPREGTGPHRQWVQSAIAALEAEMRRAEAAKDVAAANLADEKINALTEYLNVNLAAVDRVFAVRQRIDGMAPAAQVAPLIDLAIGATPGTTPALSYWAAMRLLRMETYRGRIAETFRASAAALTGDDRALFRARALRAAAYFGAALSDGERASLAAQPDPAVDPLVLRPDHYMK